jgi:hypothetical protein
MRVVRPRGGFGSVRGRGSLVRLMANVFGTHRLRSLRRVLAGSSIRVRRCAPGFRGLARLGSAVIQYATCRMTVRQVVSLPPAWVAIREGRRLLQGGNRSVGRLRVWVCRASRFMRFEVRSSGDRLDSPRIDE